MLWNFPSSIYVRGYGPVKLKVLGKKANQAIKHACYWSNDDTAYKYKEPIKIKFDDWVIKIDIKYTLFVL